MMSLEKPLGTFPFWPQIVTYLLTDMDSVISISQLSQLKIAVAKES